MDVRQVDGDVRPRLEVRADGAESQIEHPVEQCIHQVIEAQAERHPDAVAVTFAGQRLTYAELNRRANQWAHRLIANGEPGMGAMMSLTALAIFSSNGMKVRSTKMIRSSAWLMM